MNELFLDLHNVTRKFGGITALTDLTLQVPPGIVGLLGPNGAGKSTLLKIILGLIPPTSGSGRVFDQTFDASQSNWKLRQIIGFMPENDSLVLGLNGLEYVALAGQLYGMTKRQAERRAHEVLSYLELDEARYRRVEEYSAGMKQRAKLAQAVVHDPKVLLLDEPTSGLDPSGRDKMLKLISELASLHQKSIILSTHLLADVESICQQVVVLAEGRLQRIGTVRELCSRRIHQYVLKVHGDIRKFQSLLERNAIIVNSSDGLYTLKVTTPADWSNRRFFELASESEATIRGIVNDDESLDGLFTRA